MPLNYKAGGGGDFKPCPAGNHIAVCNLIADLGYQPSSFGDKHQVYIRFEIPAERIEYTKDGKSATGPVVIGQKFTASMHEKASLRKQLEGWRGRKFTDEEAEAFDVSAILGKGCMLNVIHNVKEGKLYANISSISALPKGMTAPNSENGLLLYTEESKDSFSKLPDWLQEIISKQIKQVPQDRDINQDYPNSDALEITDDDIPF